MSPSPPSSDLTHVLGRLAGRGRGFERLAGWFLLHDSEWSLRISRVWLWEDWPGRWGPDRGIDLVAETGDGHLIAVQAKHYDPAYAITKSDVDSFLSESSRPVFAERLLIATTMGLAVGARQVIAAQEKPVTLLLRDRLDQAAADWAAFETDRAVVPVTRATPKPHQERALSEVVAGLAHAARGKLIMPCGTGKTLTALWASERLSADTVLVLVPTLVLVRQLAQVWAAQSAPPLKLLKVCSDTAADDEVTRADLPAIEVGPVTTDPQEIAAFLNGDGRRVVISTYDSSPRIADALAQMPGVRLDLVICDEAHHCAGLQAGPHKTVLDDKRIPARRRLFVTATPTVFAPAARVQAAHAHARVASMDDTRLFGPTLHRLTFRQAVEQGLLCPYQVVVMPIRDHEVSELVHRRTLVTPDHGEHITDAYTLAAQIAALRAMGQHECSRLVAFHAGVPESKRFTAHLQLAAALMDADARPAQFHAAHVDGYMTRTKRELALRRFLEDLNTPQILSNVRLLAEGVDVPGIDAICLMNSQRNPAWIAQVVGRVVRTAPGKEIGTIILPVLLREGQTLREALRSSDHRPVLNVLAAMRSVDEDIVHVVDSVRVELGPRRSGSSQTGEWRIDAPTEIDEQFAEAVEIALIDILNARSSRPPAKAAVPGRRPADADEDEPIVIPAGADDLDFSDPQTIDLGLRIAEHWGENRSDPAGTEPFHLGFPLARWWDRVKELWEEGLLPDEVKPRCAEHFNALAVDRDQFPRVRRELVELDRAPLEDRIDAWLLLAWLRRTGDDDLDELARTDYIGWRGKVPTERIVALLPTALDGEDRADLAVAALKTAGRALQNASDDLIAARQGFLEGLNAPGKSHDLDVQHNAMGRPVGTVACYAQGWDAAQAVLKEIGRTSGRPPSRPGKPRRGNQARRRRPRVQRPSGG